LPINATGRIPGDRKEALNSGFALVEVLLCYSRTQLVAARSRRTIANPLLHDVESAQKFFVCRANRIDYWIRQRIVPCPPQNKVNSARDRRAALTAIGKRLKDQYDALATPLPPQLATLGEQLRTEPAAR
jgi:hypothetical protein